MANAIETSQIIKMQSKTKNPSGSVFLTTVTISGKVLRGCQIGIVDTFSDRVMLQVSVPLATNYASVSQYRDEMFMLIADINKDTFAVKASTMTFAEDTSPGILLSTELVISPESVTDLRTAIDSAAFMLFQSCTRVNKTLTSK